MDLFIGWFVQQPFHILGVSAALLIVAIVLRRRAKVDVLFVAALAWLAYAAWEWWVLIVTPDADIRVDLLLIWPLLIVLMLWAVWRFLRNTRI